MLIEDEVGVGDGWWSVVGGSAVWRVNKHDLEIDFVKPTKISSPSSCIRAGGSRVCEVVGPIIGALVAVVRSPCDECSPLPPPPPPT